MPICPNGHPTQSSDYCDICGIPLAASAPAAPSPATPASVSQGKICSNCGATVVKDALFCEACGFDFTTGTPPRSGLLDLDSPVEIHPIPASVVMAESDRAAATQADLNQAASALNVNQEAVNVDVNKNETPEAEEPSERAVSTEEVVGAEIPPADAVSTDALEETTPSAEEAVDAEVVPAVAGTDEAPATVAGDVVEVNLAATDAEVQSADAKGLRAVEYVAELWVDPDWFKVQESDEEMPAPGLPVVVPLTKDEVLVGRVSRSKGIEPDVDCTVDTGCSRRQAMLTLSGDKWSVEDLGSSNGTFVGPASGPLPQDPIKPGRTQLDEDDRIYVGAWTRIVVRKATDEERAELAG